MGTILILILLLVFVITPIIKIGMAFWRARKQFKQFYNTMSGHGTGRQRDEDQQDDSQDYYRRKKYDSNDGEYVAFEDITVDESTTEYREQSEQKKTTHTEQQIVDVEWEDL